MKILFDISIILDVLLVRQPIFNEVILLFEMAPINRLVLDSERRISLIRHKRP